MASARPINQSSVSTSNQSDEMGVSRPPANRETSKSGEPYFRCLYQDGRSIYSRLRERINTRQNESVEVSRFEPNDTEGLSILFQPSSFSPYFPNHRDRISARPGGTAEMSLRGFVIRTKGLYKKGNTLHNLFNPKVAIIVEPGEGQGPIEGYLSHRGNDWPTLSHFLTSLGIRPEHLYGPDNFDTVADRVCKANTNRTPASTGVSSFSSGTLTIPSAPSPGDGQYTEDDRFMAEIMESLTQAQPSAMSQPVSIAPPAAMQPSPTPISVLGRVPDESDAPAAKEENPREVGLGKVPMYEPPTGSLSGRKRKRAGGSGRRRKMTTRSQERNTLFID